MTVLIIVDVNGDEKQINSFFHKKEEFISFLDILAKKINKNKNNFKIIFLPNMHSMPPE